MNFKHSPLFSSPEFSVFFLPCSWRRSKEKRTLARDENGTAIKRFVFLVMIFFQLGRGEGDVISLQELSLMKEGFI